LVVSFIVDKVEKFEMNSDTPKHKAYGENGGMYEITSCRFADALYLMTKLMGYSVLMI
jgi:hypothetical protein